MMERPKLLIIAGPNGAGKTTVTSQIPKHEWVEGCEYIYCFVFNIDTSYGMIDFLKGCGMCIRCVKDGTSAINEISTDTENGTVTGYFDILGRKLKEDPKQGIYIIQYANGTAKKVMR